MAKKSTSRTSSRATRRRRARAAALKAAGKARPGANRRSGSDQLPVAVTHGFPTPAHPYYHLRLAFSLEGADSYQVKRVKVNGQRVRDFEPCHDFRFVKNQMLKPGGPRRAVRALGLEAARDRDRGGPGRGRPQGRPPARPEGPGRGPRRTGATGTRPGGTTPASC